MCMGEYLYLQEVVKESLSGSDEGVFLKGRGELESV